MFNTHATAKIVYNKNLNTFRLLVAFNTNKVTVQNAVYKSGDLICVNSIINAMQCAMRNLRITGVQHLQFADSALANLDYLQINSIYMQE